MTVVRRLGSPESMDVVEEGSFTHSTTLTNKQRGNEVTVRPASLDGEYREDAPGAKCTYTTVGVFNSVITSKYKKMNDSKATHASSLVS